ncbi:MAG: TorF family putative porin [Woeseiaceae bacterium]
MILKNKFKLTSVALASAVVMGGLSVSTLASADVGYNATVSSMYLWRGQDVSNGSAISGGIDFTDKSGFYASAWASSGVSGGTVTAESGSSNGYELDLYAGFAGKVAGVGYDISVWDIDYPQTSTDSGTEIALGLSYGDFSFGYIDGEQDYSYTTLGFSKDKFGITYGMSDAGAGAEYSHVNLSYAATDALSLTVSKLSDDGAGKPEEMLISVSYSLPIGK